MARYHMYWQVYLHPVARSYETIISMIFRRMKEQWQKDADAFSRLEMFVPFLQDGPAGIEDLYVLDESAALYGFSLLEHGDDPVLRDLASRARSRRLFDYVEYEDESQLEKIRRKAQESGYDPRYYVVKDHVVQKPYSPYQGRGGTHVIWIVSEDGSLHELSEKSTIVRALTEAEFSGQELIYFPKEIGI